MSKHKSIAAIGIILILLVSCHPATETPKGTTQFTSFLEQTDVPTAFPLAQPGQYYVGTRNIVTADPSRDNRKVSITVWYPASTGFTKGVPTRDADPDLSGKPYPLILSSTKMANVIAPYLVSHGFTWASVDGIDYYLFMNEEMIDQPRDILFALNQVATNPPTGLEGLIDVENVGVTGYSFDGYNALALSGARIDPQYYMAQCPTPDATTEGILSNLSAFDCDPAAAWDAYAAHAGDAITSSQDGLWQPMTDVRIRAVMPMACEGWWLFGERGLAAVDLPVLIVDSTKDDLYAENVLIYDHLGTADKTLISFVGQDHYMIFSPKVVARMAHFAIAFFGFHLQGREDFAQYFSPDFISSFDDLAWGVYTDK